MAVAASPGRWALVVARERAALFADSRYWVQAEARLAGTGIELVRIGRVHRPHLTGWSGARGAWPAVDAQVLGLAAAQALKSRLDRCRHRAAHRARPAGGIWPDRARCCRSSRCYAHREPCGAQSAAQAGAGACARRGAPRTTHHFIVQSPTTSRGLTNLRGSDVNTTCFPLAHLLLDGACRAAGCSSSTKVGGRCATNWRPTASASPYDRAPRRWRAGRRRYLLLIDRSASRWAFANGCRPVPRGQAINPSTLLKSRKSSRPKRPSSARRQSEDGAAMCIFTAGFGPRCQRRTPTELSIDERLSAARAANRLRRVVSDHRRWRPTARSPAHRATPESFAVIEGDGLLLIDFGAQYLGGTTDISRGVGHRHSVARRCGATSRGAEGHDLSRAGFPRGTPADARRHRARRCGNRAGLRHGTGHGVGLLLNVHEGPQSISRTVPTRTWAWSRA